MVAEYADMSKILFVAVLLWVASTGAMFWLVDRRLDKEEACTTAIIKIILANDRADEGERAATRELLVALTLAKATPLTWGPQRKGWSDAFIRADGVRYGEGSALGPARQCLANQW